MTDHQANLPKRKQTVLGLYVTAQEAYEKWQAAVKWLVDAITAVVLFAVLGFRWSLLLGLAVGAVPGLQLFPAYSRRGGLGGRGNEEITNWHGSGRIRCRTNSRTVRTQERK